MYHSSLHNGSNIYNTSDLPNPCGSVLSHSSKYESNNNVSSTPKTNSNHVVSSVAQYTGMAISPKISPISNTTALRQWRRRTSPSACAGANNVKVSSACSSSSSSSTTAVNSISYPTSSLAKSGDHQVCNNSAVSTSLPQITNNNDVPNHQIMLHRLSNNACSVNKDNSCIVDNKHDKNQMRLPIRPEVSYPHAAKIHYPCHYDKNTIPYRDSYYNSTSQLMNHSYKEDVNLVRQQSLTDHRNNDPSNVKLKNAHPDYEISCQQLYQQSFLHNSNQTCNEIKYKQACREISLPNSSNEMPGVHMYNRQPVQDNRYATTAPTQMKHVYESTHAMKNDYQYMHSGNYQTQELNRTDYAHPKIAVPRPHKEQPPNYNTIMQQQYNKELKEIEGKYKYYYNNHCDTGPNQYYRNNSDVYSTEWSQFNEYNAPKVIKQPTSQVSNQAYPIGPYPHLQSNVVNRNNTFDSCFEKSNGTFRPLQTYANVNYSNVPLYPPQNIKHSGYTWDHNIVKNTLPATAETLPQNIPIPDNRCENTLLNDKYPFHGIHSNNVHMENANKMHKLDNPPPSYYHRNSQIQVLSDVRLQNYNHNPQMTPSKYPGYFNGHEGLSYKKLTSLPHPIPVRLYNEQTQLLNRDYGYQFHPHGDVPLDFNHHIRTDQIISHINDTTEYCDESSKASLNLKQFLETWDEGEEPEAQAMETNVANLPDVVLSNKIVNKNFEQEKDLDKKEQDDQMFYILESTNISEEIVWSNYKHVQQIDKLPENIKIINGFEEINIDSQNSTNASFVKNSTIQNSVLDVNSDRRNSLIVADQNESKSLPNLEEISVPPDIPEINISENESCVELQKKTEKCFPCDVKTAKNELQSLDSCSESNIDNSELSSHLSNVSENTEVNLQEDKRHKSIKETGVIKNCDTFIREEVNTDILMKKDGILSPEIKNNDCKIVQKNNSFECQNKDVVIGPSAIRTDSVIKSPENTAVNTTKEHFTEYRKENADLTKKQNESENLNERNNCQDDLNKEFATDNDQVLKQSSDTTLNNTDKIENSVIKENVGFDCTSDKNKVVENFEAKDLLVGCARSLKWKKSKIKNNGNYDFKTAKPKKCSIDKICEKMYTSKLELEIKGETCDDKNSAEKEILNDTLQNSDSDLSTDNMEQNSNEIGDNEMPKLTRYDAESVETSSFPSMPEITLNIEKVTEKELPNAVFSDVVSDSDMPLLTPVSPELKSTKNELNKIVQEQVLSAGSNCESFIKSHETVIVQKTDAVKISNDNLDKLIDVCNEFNSNSDFVIENNSEKLEGSMLENDTESAENITDIKSNLEFPETKKTKEECLNDTDSIVLSNTVKCSDNECIIEKKSEVYTVTEENTLDVVESTKTKDDAENALDLPKDDDSPKIDSFSVQSKSSNELEQEPSEVESSDTMKHKSDQLTIPNQCTKSKDKPIFESEITETLCESPCSNEEEKSDTTDIEAFSNKCVESSDNIECVIKNETNEFKIETNADENDKTETVNDKYEVSSEFNEESKLNNVSTEIETIPEEKGTASEDQNVADIGNGDNLLKCEPEINCKSYLNDDNLGQMKNEIDSLTCIDKEENKQNETENEIPINSGFEFKTDKNERCDVKNNDKDHKSKEDEVLENNFENKNVNFEPTNSGIECEEKENSKHKPNFNCNPVNEAEISLTHLEKLHENLNENDVLSETDIDDTSWLESELTLNETENLYDKMLLKDPSVELENNIDRINQVQLDQNSENAENISNLDKLTEEIQSPNSLQDCENLCKNNENIQQEINQSDQIKILETDLLNLTNQVEMVNEDSNDKEREKKCSSVNESQESMLSDIGNQPNDVKRKECKIENSVCSDNEVPDLSKKNDTPDITTSETDLRHVSIISDCNTTSLTEIQNDESSDRQNSYNVGLNLDMPSEDSDLNLNEKSSEINCQQTLEMFQSEIDDEITNNQAEVGNKTEDVKEDNAQEENFKISESCDSSMQIQTDDNFTETDQINSDLIDKSEHILSMCVETSLEHEKSENLNETISENLYKDGIVLDDSQSMPNTTEDNLENSSSEFAFQHYITEEPIAESEIICCSSEVVIQDDCSESNEEYSADNSKSEHNNTEDDCHLVLSGLENSEIIDQDTSEIVIVNNDEEYDSILTVPESECDIFQIIIPHGETDINEEKILAPDCSSSEIIMPLIVNDEIIFQDTDLQSDPVIESDCQISTTTQIDGTEFETSDAVVSTTCYDSTSFIDSSFTGVEVECSSSEITTTCNEKSDSDSVFYNSIEEFGVVNETGNVFVSYNEIQNNPLENWFYKEEVVSNTLPSKVVLNLPKLRNKRYKKNFRKFDWKDCLRIINRKNRMKISKVKLDRSRKKIKKCKYKKISQTNKDANTEKDNAAEGTKLNSDKISLELELSTVNADDLASFSNATKTNENANENVTANFDANLLYTDNEKGKCMRLKVILARNSNKTEEVNKTDKSNIFRIKLIKSDSTVSKEQSEESENCEVEQSALSPFSHLPSIDSSTTQNSIKDSSPEIEDRSESKQRSDIDDQKYKHFKTDQFSGKKRKRSVESEEIKDVGISSTSTDLEKKCNNNENASKKLKRHPSFTEILENIDNYVSKQKLISKFKIPKSNKTNNGYLNHKMENSKQIIKEKNSISVASVDSTTCLSDVDTPKNSLKVIIKTDSENNSYKLENKITPVENNVCEQNLKIKLSNFCKYDNQYKSFKTKSRWDQSKDYKERYKNKYTNELNRKRLKLKHESRSKISSDYNSSLNKKDNRHYRKLHSDEKRLISVGEMSSGRFILKSKSNEKLQQVETIPKMIIKKSSIVENHYESSVNNHSALDNAFKWQPYVKLQRNSKLDKMTNNFNREKIILRINKVKTAGASNQSLKCRIKLNNSTKQMLPHFKTNIGTKD